MAVRAVLRRGVRSLRSGVGLAAEVLHRRVRCVAVHRLRTGGNIHSSCEPAASRWRISGRPLGTAWRDVRRIHRDDCRVVVLSIPSGTFVSEPGANRAPITINYRMGLPPFAALMFVLGCAMGVGKTSIYKYIPDYF